MNSLRKRLKTISFRLEELGITHIRNKEVILRNISNNQDTRALNDFSNLCEPLKNYKRNGGGKKYRMHSPLTLFADACNSDASEALDFNVAVNAYLADKSKENKLIVINFFKKWIALNSDLIALSSNAPLVQPLLPLSKSLSDVSEQLLLLMDKKQKVNQALLEDLLEKCNTRSPADVELAVYGSLKKLL
jgi:hexosaminidase